MDASSPYSQLDRFVGDGTCIGHQLRDGKTPGPAKSARVHGEKTLDGRWVFVRYEEDRTATNPRPYKAVQYFGYDRANKRFVTVTFDNMNASYGTGVSSGWVGNGITFDEPDSKGIVSSRDVFTTGYSGMASHTGIMLDQHDKWIKHDVETCHKTL